MDCRVSLILGLGLGVLGSAGCTPSLFSRKSTPATPAETSAYKESQFSKTSEMVATKRGKDADQGKRKPKVGTCVSYGDFKLCESNAPNRTPETQRQMRSEARRAYQQALEIEPQNAAAFRGLAQVALAEGDQEGALSAYQKALRVFPRSAELWHEVGMMHSRRKEWDPAIEALSRACDLESSNRQYANVLGFCLARAGRYEQAVSHFSRVVGEPRARYNVARMMLHNGHNEPARQQLAMALEKEPKLKEARELLTDLDRPQNRPAQGVVPVDYREQANQ